MDSLNQTQSQKLSSEDAGRTLERRQMDPTSGSNRTKPEAYLNGNMGFHTRFLPQTEILNYVPSELIPSGSMFGLPAPFLLRSISQFHLFCLIPAAAFDQNGRWIRPLLSLDVGALQALRSGWVESKKAPTLKEPRDLRTLLL